MMLRMSMKLVVLIVHEHLMLHKEFTSYAKYIVPESGGSFSMFYSDYLRSYRHGENML